MSSSEIHMHRCAQYTHSYIPHTPTQRAHTHAYTSHLGRCSRKKGEFTLENSFLMECAYQRFKVWAVTQETKGLGLISQCLLSVAQTSSAESEPSHRRCAMPAKDTHVHTKAIKERTEQLGKECFILPEDQISNVLINKVKATFNLNISLVKIFTWILHAWLLSLRNHYSNSQGRIQHFRSHN